MARGKTPTPMLSPTFMRAHKLLMQVASTSTRGLAVSEGVCAAKRTYEGPIVSAFVRNLRPRLDVPEAVQRLMDPNRPGRFRACRCSESRQVEFGSCFLRLYTSEPDWLAKTCRGAVRLAKASKGKDLVSMARGTRSFRIEHRAKTHNRLEKEPRASGASASSTGAGAGPAESAAVPLDLLAGVSEQDWLLADRATAKATMEAFVKEATVHMMNPNILGAGHGVCMEAKREICKVSSDFYFTPQSVASPGTEAPQHAVLSNLCVFSSPCQAPPGTACATRWACLPPDSPSTRPSLATRRPATSAAIWTSFLCLRL